MSRWWTRSWRRTAPRRPDLAARIVEAAQTPPQPWKNGGGSTRELLAWPAGGEWKLRISMADISADGPFSPFPGVERWFNVVIGAGVVLGLDGERRVEWGDGPVRFDGGAAPSCRLIDGPTRDLNLMARGGKSEMQPHRTGVPRNAPFQVRALFTAVPGRWSNGTETRNLFPHTLLWDDSAPRVAWQFDPTEDAPVTGWWLGFSP